MNVVKGKDLILNRIPTELFFSKQAFSIHLSITDLAAQFNNSRYKEIFGLIQFQALSSGILCIGNLFERPSTRYPNFSIPTAISYLQADLAALPLNNASKTKITQYLSDDPQEQQLLILNPQKLKRCLLLDLADKCPKSPSRPGYQIDLDFEAVKVLRDKRVAHYEDHKLAGLTETDWNGIKRLLSYAESFVNLVGYGLFGFSQQGWIDPGKIDFKNESGGLAIRKLVEESLL